MTTARRTFAASIATVALVASACSGSRGGPPEGRSAAAALPDVRPPATIAPVVRRPSAAGAPTVGVTWDWSHTDQLRDTLTAFRGGTTWYELEWCLVERTPGTFDWARPDRNVARATSVGIDVAVKIRVGSCWATGDAHPRRTRGDYTASSMPLDLARYRRFVGDVVRRYRAAGVRTYAIENEVNGTGFWTGTVDEYERLARAGARAVHGVAPDTVVADSGLSSAAYGAVLAASLLQQGRDRDALAAYDAYYARRFRVRADDFPRVAGAADLRAALGRPFAARALRYATATFTLVREGVFDVYQLHFYEPAANAPRLLDLLRAEVGADVPIEVWEAGIFAPGRELTSSFDVADEAGMLLATLLAAGARWVVFLPLASVAGRDGREDRWGLLDPDERPRPAFTVAAAIADAGRRPGTQWRPLAGGRGAVAVGAAPAGDVAVVSPAPAPPPGGRVVASGRRLEVVSLPPGVDGIAWANTG